ncbi:MAG: restriction endonuclease subunit S [Candidatus Saccharibacteria bacterium]|nr:restriction endonuclease subunit S [Microbacteriaceae bacterium]
MTKTLRSIVPGSFLVARMQVVHGATAFVEERFSGAAISKSYSSFLGTEACDARYFAWLARHPFMYDYFMDSSHGVAIEKMTFDQVRWLSLRVPLPPRGEQARIVEVLDTLEAQLKMAERIIDKLTLQSQGLVDSLIGQRLADRTLGRTLVGLPGNGIYKPAQLIGRGTLLVGQTAITADRTVDVSLARRAVVSSSELGRFGLEPNDVLVSRVFATLEGVGQPGLVKDLTEPAVYESNMMRLRFDPAMADPYFVFRTLQLPSARQHIARHANLSNQASISQGVMTGLPLWLPSPSEQRVITDRLHVADVRIETEKAELRKLLLLRQGLISDLLTGRVRVPTEAS